jgi:hypothetical protein
MSSLSGKVAIGAPPTWASPGFRDGGPQTIPAANLPDWVTREAYSEEVSSCGLWAGGGPIPYAAFYSYAYPEPVGFAAASVQPGTAFYSSDLREFILPYDVVRQSESPDTTLLEFLQTTYDAAANLAKWDRSSLERRSQYEECGLTNED